MSKAGNYNLGFISDQDIYNHVKQTILKYRSAINFSEFVKSKIDPIKATFDIAIYGLSGKEFIEREIMRQIDKSNNNHIGYFHQNIFQYINGWKIPDSGYDIVNEELGYYVEIKNKFNTMNSNSKENIFRKMWETITTDDDAICLLVEVIAKKSRNEPWSCSLDKQIIKHDRIRTVSIDKFYKIATGDKYSFAKLCRKLPVIISDVIKNESTQIQIPTNEITQHLAQKNSDPLTALYLLAFANYEGFENFIPER